VVCLVEVAVCLALPTLVAGRRHRLWGVAMGALACIVPGLGMLSLARESVSGFCF
jgi:hypothetical protein